MRQKHNMLLAGVAALAVLAGGGIAAAQQSPQGQNNAGPGMSGQGTAQTQSGKDGAAAGMERRAQTGSPSGNPASPGAKTNLPSMARQGAENGKPENRSAQTNRSGSQNQKQSAQGSQEHFGENAKGETKQRIGENAKSKNEARERISATEKNNRERMGANTRSERDRSGMSAERNERNGGLKGLQGNTSIPMQGSHVNLTSEQRTRIRDTVIDARGAPRVGHVDFNVSVGTVVPRERVHVVPVPETLVRIDPQWRGYLYFVVEDQVIIVNPRDMRIVAVLDV